MRRSAWLLAVLALAVGCQSLLGVPNPLAMGGCGDSRETPEPRVTLESPVSGVAYTDRVTVVGDTGKIIVHGVDQACASLSASVERDGRELTLLVNSTPTPTPCAQVAIPTYYRCTVYRIEAGKYDFTVALTDRDVGETTFTTLDTVFTSPVTVR
jgi:hypothetical protein